MALTQDFKQTLQSASGGTMAHPPSQAMTPEQFQAWAGTTPVPTGFVPGAVGEKVVGAVKEGLNKISSLPHIDSTDTFASGLAKVGQVPATVAGAAGKVVTTAAEPFLKPFAQANEAMVGGMDKLTKMISDNFSPERKKAIVDRFTPLLQTVADHINQMEKDHPGQNANLEKGAKNFVDSLGLLLPEAAGHAIDTVRGAFPDPQVAETINNHTASANQVTQNLPPEDIAKLGGTPKLIERLKTNIVDQLTKMKSVDAANKISALDPSKFTSPEAFSQAAHQAVSTTASNAIDSVVEGAGSVADIAKERVGSIATDLGNTISEGMKPSLTPEEATGQIVQGQTSDVASAKRAIESLDVDGVKTQADLQARIKKAIPALAKEVDAEFAKDTSGGHSIKSFEQTVGEGKAAVKVNYVRQAIDQLKAYYEKVGDAEGQAKMKALENKAKINGLTYGDINNLARTHGSELNAYNANGEAASGLTKQAAENTRAGLKTTARTGLGTEEAQKLDAKLSDLYDLQSLIDKQVEAVNKAAQKTPKQGAIPKAVGKAIDIANTVTGNPLQAIGKKLGNVGASGALNPTELEQNLEGNLQTIKEAQKVREATAKGKAK